MASMYLAWCQSYNRGPAEGDVVYRGAGPQSPGIVVVIDSVGEHVTVQWQNGVQTSELARTLNSLDALIEETRAKLTRHEALAAALRDVTGMV